MMLGSKKTSPILAKFLKDGGMKEINIFFLPVDGKSMNLELIEVLIQSMEMKCIQKKIKRRKNDTARKIHNNEALSENQIAKPAVGFRKKKIPKDIKTRSELK
mmetsp:Transcript_35392/g.45450  ORF Transcript_35392/g.45450 Transcript_35392/m.45450 type:complete len:103 (-) Transcript_35392:298-606(-)